MYQQRQEVSEEQWDKLFTADRLKGNLQKAEQKRGTLNDDKIKLFRYLCKHNSYFLAKTVLGYDRLRQVHIDLCNWIDSTDGERFRLVLMPRGHFKSTIDTITKSIQVALPFDTDFDFDLLRDKTTQQKIDLEKLSEKIYPANLGPDSRILIGHETAGMAQTFLYEITNHFTGNELLMALFPEIIPSLKLHRMNRTELELPRSKPWKEATFSTMGVGGKSQGYHFNYLFLDDLIGDKAADSETEMATAKNWVDGIQPFFSLFSKDKIMFSGTRYANDDLYDHLFERYGDQLKVYRRALTEKGEDGKTKYIFPEEFNDKSTVTIRKNKKIFNAQYMNDPDAGATSFNEEWLREFEWQSPHIITLFSKDYTNDRTTKKIIRLRDCHIALLWDPALTGDTGWNVVATDSNNRKFVLESFEGEISANDAIEKMFELFAKYSFDVLGIEEVLFSELYRRWLEREFIFRGVRFTILPVETKQKSKQFRVAELAMPFSSGEYYFNESRYSFGTRDRTGKQSDLMYSIKKFGSIKQYHSLDALGYAPEVCKPGFDRKKLEDVKKQEMERRKLAVSNQTGYSTIKYKVR
jgi:hypothetical protein